MPKPNTLPKPWNRLVEAYGGRQVFAEMIGVSGVTVYRWAHCITGMSTLQKQEVLRLGKEHKINMSKAEALKD